MTLPSTHQDDENRPSRDRADYGFARLRDQMFDAVAALWRRRKAEGLTQKELAARIGRDPAWVSRNLAAPGNWTLRTAGELIQSLEGEAEIQVAALEDERERRVNYDAYDGYVPTAAGAVFLMNMVTLTADNPSTVLAQYANPSLVLSAE